MNVGDEMAGGIYVGCIANANTVYALIVAPRAEGEFVLPWGKSRKLSGADSTHDGFANTEAMAAANSELARTIRALRIGGHDDWYLPSRAEAFLAYSAQASTADFAPYWYWTSTHHASNPEYAWAQGFTSGNQYDYHQGDELRARAVRRVAICSFDPSVILEAA